MTGIVSPSLAPRGVCGLVDAGALAGILLAPLLSTCSLGGPGRGLWTATGPVEFAHALGVTVCRHEARRDRRGHTGPATGRVTVVGHWTVRCLEKGVGSLGGVAGIARRQLLPPGIVATLCRGWSLSLWLRAAPFPGCSSACQGPLHSWMQIWGPCFQLLASQVPGCCLVLLFW